MLPPQKQIDGLAETDRAGVPPQAPRVVSGLFDGPRLVLGSPGALAGPSRRSLAYPLDPELFVASQPCSDGRHRDPWRTLADTRRRDVATGGRSARSSACSVPK